MNILLTGASGLIGQAVLTRLLAAQHQVIAVCRRPPAQQHANLRWHAADVASMQQDDWLPLLDDVTLVINAIGIFREHGTQTFAALHVDASIRLFDACVLSGVARLIQISALGAALDASTGYARSKAEADAAVRSLPMDSVVLRPSLVYADHGASSRVFRQLAALPCLVTPADAGMVQPIHLDDLADTILRIVDHPKPTSLPRILNAVGPRPMAWVAYLQALRQGMGLDQAKVWQLPTSVVNASVSLLGLLPQSLANRDSLALLRAGNQADAAPITAILGRPLRDPSTFTQAALAADAVWASCQPMLRASLAFVWVWTAYVSLAYPAVGLGLLNDMGLPAAWHLPALWLGSGLDLLLGLLTLVRPGKRLWLAQIGLILGYTLLISLYLPAWWLHPFGAVSKNLPILAILLTLAMLQPPTNNTNQ